MQYSMRKKIITNSVLGLMILLLLMSVAGDLYLIKWLKKGFDQSLASKSRVLVNLVKHWEDGLDFDFAYDFMPEFADSKDPEFFQIWVDGKNVMEKSVSIIKINQAANLPVTDFTTKYEQYKDITLPDGRNGRMVWRSFYPQINPRFGDSVKYAHESMDRLYRDFDLPLVTLAVAKEKQSMDKTIRDFILGFIVVVLIFILLAGVTIWHNVNRGMKPIRHISRKMSLLGADNLSDRLAHDDNPVELNEMINQFNLMINRLKGSFDREKRFSSDVAHELRTPISEIRLLCEIALRGKEDQSYYQDIHESARIMENTVSNLMSLARAEKGGVILEPKVLCLSSKVDLSWQRHFDLAQQRSVSLDNLIDQEIQIISSSVELDIILNNLISNAIIYSTRGSVVTTSWENKELYGSFRIKNFTYNMSEEDLSKMFDRLWQKNTARTSTENTGLGLSLVQTYASLLGMKVSAKLDQNGQLNIELNHIYQDR